MILPLAFAVYEIWQFVDVTTTKLVKDAVLWKIIKSSKKAYTKYLAFQAIKSNETRLAAFAVG